MQEEVEARAVVDAVFGLAPEAVPGVQEPVWVLGALLDGVAVAAVGWVFAAVPAGVQELVLAVVVLEFVPAPEPVELVGVLEAEGGREGEW